MNPSRSKIFDYQLPIEERVASLISEMTLEEKISQVFSLSLPIERLNIPKYDWRNECIHGVAFAGTATVFPQSIGLAATWNVDLIHHVAKIISDEARAKHHEGLRKNQIKRYQGLTFSAPNINIFRDPRWGRGQETYGEDPYLTSRMAVAFIKGLQGEDSKYFKLISAPKHFAVHSGPESKRHVIDVHVSNKDLYETYLPAFEAAIKEGKAYSIMGAYNRLYGEPCCASPFLLQKILRDKWNFKGYVIADGGAVEDIYKNHKVAHDYADAAAKAIESGCDLLNPLDVMTKVRIKRFHISLQNAVKEGVLNEETIDSSLKHLFEARCRLGLFDPPETVPFSQIDYKFLFSDEHKQLALKAAEESIVLLKNSNNFLPLKKDLNSIALIGPNIDNIRALSGDYFGIPLRYITPLRAFKEFLPKEIKLYYTKGCDLLSHSEENIKKALKMVEKSDICIAVLGLSSIIESEEVFVAAPDKGDRTDLNLPDSQELLLNQLFEIEKPIIIVLTGGGPLAVNLANEHATAILQLWYSGQEGGSALYNTLFGNSNPSGRLPLTFYKSVKQLPEFEDYSMENRTYRYFNGETLFPFGHGLSYSVFKYSNLNYSTPQLSIGQNLKVSFTVENLGPYPGFEVIQLYVSKKSSNFTVPIRSLKRFKKIFFKSGDKKKIGFNFNCEDFKIFDNDGNQILEKGEFLISIGGSQPAKDKKDQILYQTIEIK